MNAEDVVCSTIRGIESFQTLSVRLIRKLTLKATRRNIDMRMAI